MEASLTSSGYEAGDSVTGNQARCSLPGNEARDSISGSAARNSISGNEARNSVSGNGATGGSGTQVTDSTLPMYPPPPGVPNLVFQQPGKASPWRSLSPEFSPTFIQAFGRAAIA